VKILIDNLDKGWNDNADLGSISDLLFGLLNVIHRIAEEFQRQCYATSPNNLSITRRRIVDLQSHGSPPPTVLESTALRTFSQTPLVLSEIIRTYNSSYYE